MDDVGTNNVKDLQKLVETEGNLQLVFDNFDFRILSNVVLPNPQNSDMHWCSEINA